MNRAERRRMDKQIQAKDPLVTMRRSALAKMENDIANKAAIEVFTLMLSIPATIIHRNFGELIRKESNGMSREERFIDMCLDLYSRFEDGAVSLENIRDQFEMETGYKIEPKRTLTQRN